MNNFGPENLSWFSPEITRSQEALARKGSFWFGADVASEKMVIAASTVNLGVSLKLRKENLPDIEGLSLSTLHLLRTSTRSCYAQVGADIKPEIGKLRDEDIERIKRGEEIDCPAIAINHSRRAIELKDSVLRFFWVDANKHLIGDRLVEAVRKMKIDGQEGKDWFLGEVGDEGFELFGGAMKKETPITLALRIKDKKLWIPFPVTDQPVRVNSKKDLPKYLEPVPSNLTPDFMICETVPVSLPRDLVGVINLGIHDEGGVHSGSPLIDPGFEGPIRLEIIKPNKHPDFVELLMYERASNGVE